MRMMNDIRVLSEVLRAAENIICHMRTGDRVMGHRMWTFLKFADFPKRQSDSRPDYRDTTNRNISGITMGGNQRFIMNATILFGHVVKNLAIWEFKNYVSLNKVMIRPIAT